MCDGSVQIKMAAFKTWAINLKRRHLTVAVVYAGSTLT